MAGLDQVPDIRDGLTRVERAALLAMPGVGEARVKCATAVQRAREGVELDGVALFEAMARFEQGWLTRWIPTDGRGNFGSIDGDPPAAAIYGECRLGGIGRAILGAQAGAVDDSVELVRGAFPQLLANGSWDGIAQIPSHDLGELADAIALRIAEPECSLDAVLAVLPGPDFASGGAVVDPGEVRAAYASGRGSVRVRGVIGEQPNPDYRESQRDASGRTVQVNGVEYELRWWPGPDRLVITELPFGVLRRRGVVGELERAWLAGELDVADVTDYSDGRGMRVVVEVPDGIAPAATREHLFERTSLEVAVPVALVALVDGEPRQCTFLELLDAYVAHQRQVRGGESADVDAAIVSDLRALAAKHGDGRRTRIAAP